MIKQASGGQTLVEKSEETRIVNKINRRKTFQSESWEYLEFILEYLRSTGFNRSWVSHDLHDRATGGQFFLMDEDFQKVTVLAADLLGKFVQVEFHRPD